MSRRHEPSHSIDAEQCVLGGLLVDNRAIPLVEDSGLRPDHFFDQRHARIFAAITEQLGRGMPADSITTFEALGVQADRCGGLEYLTALEQCVPSASNVQRYAAIVLEHAASRELGAAAEQALDVAHGDGTSADKLDRIATLFGRVARQETRGPVSVGDLVVQRAGLWQALATGEEIPGVRTGLPTLDGALGGGLKPGKVGVIAARPSVGKTSLGASLATTFAGAGKPALILSMEMTGGELVDRMVASAGGLDLQGITRGTADAAQLANAGELVRGLRIFIDDTPALSLLQIRAKARQVQRQHGLGLCIVDHVQLARGDENARSRHHAIESVSRGLKALAKELGISILVLSQLNRASLARGDGEPTLSDLKESGSLEEDADFVLLLHPRERMSDGSTLVVGILAKNRQGRRGRIALRFEGATQRWSESTADVSRRKDTA